MAPHRAAVMYAGLLCAALPRSPAFADDLAIQDPAPHWRRPISLSFRKCGAGSTPTTGFMMRVRRSTCRPKSCPRRSVIPSNIGGRYFSWFFNPRINVGAMVNTGGKTSYAFTGLTWRIPIYKAFFFEGEFGGAINNAPTHPEEDRVDMGCRLTFRELGGFGYQFNEHVDLIVNIEHISHATFCTHINPGLTQIGARIGYKF